MAKLVPDSNISVKGEQNLKDVTLCLVERGMGEAVKGKWIEEYIRHSKVSGVGKATH